MLALTRKKGESVVLNNNIEHLTACSFLKSDIFIQAVGLVLIKITSPLPILL